MRRAVPAALWAAFLAALVSVALAVIIGAAVSLGLIHRANSQWCPVLRQITETPPKAHAPAGQRQFYGEMIALRSGFGCS